MVVDGWFPTCGRVTGNAIGIQAALVDVFRGMAGKAIAGCTLQDMLDMTSRTNHINVFAGQFEGGQIMVESGRGPASSGVAGTTQVAKATLVGIIRRVAGVAVLRG